MPPSEGRTNVRSAPVPPKDTRPDYDASAISVLEGLEPVRTRPGMYIGSTGPAGLHHLVWEVVDNAVDEAMGGYGDRIEVTLRADGGCGVRDEGRGIPVDPYPSGQHAGKSAAEVVLTVLHAGGKFGSGGYLVSGGLHGVGVSVVNALSTRLVLDVWRDGTHWRQTFSARHEPTRVVPGVPDGPVQAMGSAPKSRTGTQVTFWPDPGVFDDGNVAFSGRTIAERLKMQAYIHRGLTFVLRDERPGKESEQVFRFDGGIRDLATELNGAKKPLFPGVIAVANVHDPDDATGQWLEVDAALGFNEGYTETLLSFANGIATVDGGKHAEGIRKAVTRAVANYAKAKGHLKDKDANLTGDDVREGFTAVVSVKLRQPQFEGQTKGKLGNTWVAGAVESIVYAGLSTWLEEHPGEGKAIVDKARAAMRLRTQTEAEREADRKRRKTGLEGAGLPDKLYDCLSGSGDTELFIVEGDSAGGSAVRARNPKFQAIFPLRGKPLNAETAKMESIVRNAELNALVQIVGAGRGTSFDVERMRYSRIVIMADADIDGGHIQLLLLTFFYRQMTDLVAEGRLYIACPPLFSTVVGKEKRYLRDEAAKAAFLAEHPNHAREFNRLKGLGEMDWQELRDTTMDPVRRRLLQVSVEDAAAVDRMLSNLMGDDAETKWEFITTNADEYAAASLRLSE
jgi:DNA gyrase subunit B